MKEIELYAQRLRMFFEKEKETIGLPFFYSFPKNACEGSSCILGLLLMEKYPNLTVEIIHGYSEEPCEHHYWVEVENIIYDITADQFDEIESPIYGVVKHPMGQHFIPIERDFASIFLYKYTQRAIEMHKINPIYKRIKTELFNRL